MGYYGIVYALIWPITIIGLIGFFIARKRKNADPSKDGEWYLQIWKSKEDEVSQLFFLLALFFLGLTLFAFNRDGGDPLSWRTILLATSAIGLVGAYYLKAVTMLAISLVGLTTWWGAQAGQWIDGKDIKTSGIFFGLSLLALLLYVIGHLHEKQEKRKRFALVYEVFGIIAVTAILFFFSSKPGITVIDQMTEGASVFRSWQLGVSLVLFLIAGGGITLYCVARKVLFPYEAFAVCMLAVLFLATALLPQHSMFVQTGRKHISAGELSDMGSMVAVAYNVVLFFELLGLIFSGYSRRETWLINLGTVFLFLLIIVKYFDWFFTFLDKSIFFIGAGILLFVVGWSMEKGRKYMITNIKSQAQTIP